MSSSKLQPLRDDLPGLLNLLYPILTKRCTYVHESIKWKTRGNNEIAEPDGPLRKGHRQRGVLLAEMTASVNICTAEMKKATSNQTKKEHL